MSEKYRLLHVEDDGDWQDLVRERLKKDFSITTCSSINAVRLALKRGEEFDIALVDLSMNGSGSGWEINTPEDLVVFLKGLGIGVAVHSGVSRQVRPQIERQLGVKIFDKDQPLNSREIISAALYNNSRG